MKKDRNYGPMPMPTPYPMMGGYPGGMPNQMGGYPNMNMMPNQNMPMNQPTPAITNATCNCGNEAGEKMQWEQMQAQLNNLDRRVSRLENMLQDTKSISIGNNTYTDSNYHMM